MMAESADRLQAAQIDAALMTVGIQITEARNALQEGRHEDVLGRVAAIDVTLGHIKADAVMRAHRWGSSWTEIGQALGISKQAAWERYRHLIGQ